MERSQERCGFWKRELGWGQFHKQVPSLPGAAGIMRSGSWFGVSLEDSAMRVTITSTQTPREQDITHQGPWQGWHQRPCSVSWERKSPVLSETGGLGPRAEGQTMVLPQAEGCGALAFAQGLPAGLVPTCREIKQTAGGIVNDNLKEGGGMRGSH